MKCHYHVYILTTTMKVIDRIEMDFVFVGNYRKKFFIARKT